MSTYEQYPAEAEPVRPVFVAVLVGLVLASLGLADAAFAAGSSTKPVSKATTPAWVDGRTVTIQYPQNFLCDKSVPSSAPSGCEVGTDSNVGPASNADRLVLRSPSPSSWWPGPP